MQANPRTRAQEKIRDVLNIIGKFGFSSPENITLASRAAMRGYGERLHEAGFLTKREVSGLVVGGKAVSKIYGLSQKGADLTGCDPVDIWKISAGRMAHTLIAQRIVIEGFKKNIIPCAGLAVDFRVEAYGSGIHFRPDVTLQCQGLMDDGNNVVVYLEVELSGKSGGELDRFYAKLNRSMCLVHFESPQLMHRYICKLGEFVIKEELPKWFRRADGNYIPDGTLPFDELDLSGVYFQTLDNQYGVEDLVLEQRHLKSYAF